MLNYSIELIPRGGLDESTMWHGQAINVIDAIQIAKQSVWPKLHTAKVHNIRNGENHGEQEGNAR